MKKNIKINSDKILFIVEEDKKEEVLTEEGDRLMKKVDKLKDDFSNLGPLMDTINKIWREHSEYKIIRRKSYVLKGLEKITESENIEIEII